MTEVRFQNDPSVCVTAVWFLSQDNMEIQRHVQKSLFRRKSLKRYVFGDRFHLMLVDKKQIWKWKKKSIFETKMDKNFVSSTLALVSSQIKHWCPISALLSIKLYTCSVKEKIHWYFMKSVHVALIVMLFNWWYEIKTREVGEVRIEGNKIVSHDPSSP